MCQRTKVARVVKAFSWSFGCGCGCWRCLVLLKRSWSGYWSTGGNGPLHGVSVFFLVCLFSDCIPLALSLVCVVSPLVCIPSPCVCVCVLYFALVLFRGMPSINPGGTQPSHGWEKPTLQPTQQQEQDVQTPTHAPGDTRFAQRWQEILWCR